MARESNQNQYATSKDADSFWENLVLSWRLYRDPRVSNWLKRLPLVLAVVYVIVPFDLIPDVFLGVGQLDDLGVMGLMALSLTWLPRFAPAEVVEEYRQRKSSGTRSAGPQEASNHERTKPRRERGTVIDPPYNVR